MAHKRGIGACNVTIVELEQLIEELRVKQHEYVDASADVYDAKYELLRVECELCLDKKVTGKNELERNAQLWEGTKELKKTIQEKTRIADHIKVECDCLRNKLLLKMKHES